MKQFWTLLRYRMKKINDLPPIAAYLASFSSVLIVWGLVDATGVWLIILMSTALLCNLAGVLVARYHGMQAEAIRMAIVYLGGSSLIGILARSHGIFDFWEGMLLTVLVFITIHVLIFGLPIRSLDGG